MCSVVFVVLFFVRLSTCPFCVRFVGPAHCFFLGTTRFLAQKWRIEMTHTANVQVAGSCLWAGRAKLARPIEAQANPFSIHPNMLVSGFLFLPTITKDD